MSARNQDHLCTTRQAADLIGVSLRTVQLWVEEGVLPAWKTPGGHRRISRAAVEALMRERDDAVATVDSSNDDIKRAFRILVVEDEPDLMLLYKYQIEFWNLGTELLTATDGFEALMRIGESTPDVIFTDLNMPGMDGFEMIRSIVASGRLASDRIVAVTALGAKDIADNGGLPDGITLLTKPVPFDELKRIVTTLVDQDEAGS